MGLILTGRLTGREGSVPAPPKKMRTTTVARTDDGRFMKPGAEGFVECAVGENTSRIRLTGYITGAKEPETLTVTVFNDTLIKI